MIFPNSVKVERRETIGTSPTGTPKQQLVTVMNPLKCDLQPDDNIYENRVVMPESGQTVIFYKNMFCNVVDIRPNDIVTDLDTVTQTYAGDKYKVIYVNTFSMLKHMEVRLQGGVV